MIEMFVFFDKFSYDSFSNSLFLSKVMWLCMFLYFELSFNCFMFMCV